MRPRCHSPGAVAAGTCRSIRRRSASDCYTVTASINGLDAGSFTLELRDGDAVKASPKKTGVTAPVTRVERPPLEDEHEAALTTSKQGLP